MNVGKIHTKFMAVVVWASAGWVEGWDQELGINEGLCLFGMLQSIY